MKLRWKIRHVGRKKYCILSCIVLFIRVSISPKLTKFPQFSKGMAASQNSWTQYTVHHFLQMSKEHSDSFFLFSYFWGLLFLVKHNRALSVFINQQMALVSYSTLILSRLSPLMGIVSSIQKKSSFNLCQVFHMVVAATWYESMWFPNYMADWYYPLS